MSIYSLIPLIASLTNLFLAILVFSIGRKDPTRIAYTYASFALFVWNLGAFISLSVNNAAAGMIACRINGTGLIFIPSLSYLFSLSITEDRDNKRRMLAAAGLLISAVFLPFVWSTNLFFSDVYYNSWGWYPKHGAAGILFVLFLLYYAYNSLHVLWAGHRRSVDVKKNQLAYVLLGVGVGITGGVINVISITGNTFYPVGYLFNVIYTGIITYAILTYRLLDITIVFKKTLLYVSLFALTACAYSGIIYTYSLFFGESATIPEVMVFMLAAGVLTAVIILTLRERLEKSFDRLIFAGRYDYQKTLQSFGRIFAVTIDADELAVKVVKGLTDVIGVNKGSLFLFDSRKKEYVMKYSIGLAQDAARGVIFKKTDEIAKFLSTGRILIREEGKGSSNLYKTEKREENKKLLEMLGAYLSIPVIGKNGLTGILTLNRKISGHMYTDEDLRILLTLGYEIAIAADNAELFRMQKELVKQLIQSEKMVSIGNLAAGIAHDIRNPLVVIMGRTQLILAEKGLGEEVKADAQAILEGSRKIAEIIENILRLSKPSELKFGETRINDVLKRTISLVENQKFMKGITVVAQLEGSLSAVNGDGTMLEQVFFNLIKNAGDAMPLGGRLDIITRSSNGIVEAEFRDTGKGIKLEDMDKLFEPFFTTRDKGIGLGLFIIKNIISAHNGEIEVRSEPDKGAVFIVKLPVSPLE